MARIQFRSGTAEHERLRSTPLVDTRGSAVTVVVPAHNYGRYLGDCVRSVLTQRDVDVRVIIIDDCSTDDTLLVAQDLAALDTRITVLHNHRNLGMVPTVNLAMSNVATEYVVKLDADDLLSPGSLARSVSVMLSRPDVSFVYGMPRHFSGPIPQVRDEPVSSWSVWSGADWVMGRCRSSANVISQPEVVIRTDTARRVGWFDESLPHTSDMCLWLELASAGSVGRINGPTQGLYRVHDQSMQRTVHAGIMVDLLGRRDAFEHAFERRGAALPDVEILRGMARRGLAVTALDRVCRAYDRGRVDQEPVDELEAFALSVYNDARQLPEWRGLERRRAVGKLHATRNPRFFIDAVARRISDELCYRNWQRTGEW